MKRYAFSRFIHALLTLFVLSLIVFLSAHLTGDPARFLLSPEAATQADYEHLRALLGLDRPLIVQFGSFILNAAHGDLGTDPIQGRPVLTIILERLPATFELSLTAIFLSLIVGIPLGVLAAVRRNSIFDRIVTATTIFGMAAPPFWIGIMLITIFAGYLKVLPAFGSNGLSSFLLPTVTLSLYLVAAFVRLVRSSMLEALGSDYVRFARLKGLDGPRIIWKHALRNALIPLTTFAGIMFGSLLNGTIVVEQVFAWPGVGLLTLNAVNQRDFPLLQGAVLFAGFFFVVASFAVDIIYPILDPRMRSAPR